MLFQAHYIDERPQQQQLTTRAMRFLHNVYSKTVTNHLSFAIASSSLDSVYIFNSY